MTWVHFNTLIACLELSQEINITHNTHTILREDSTLFNFKYFYKARSSSKAGLTFPLYVPLAGPGTA